MSKSIVVFGATGLQGSALVKALSVYNTPSQKFTIYALSRSSATPSSDHLAALPGVKVVQAAKNYMDEPDKVFEDLELKAGDVYGVFSVQGYVSEDVELKQGLAIVDAAEKVGTQHFVYSSVDFGGLEKTQVEGFEVKRQVENRLKATGMPYTILRLCEFMDNLLPTSSFMFKVFRTVILRKTFIHHPERKHQMISARDIGRFAALAFAHPSEFAGREVSLAGDEFTIPELERKYEEVLGSGVQLTYEFLAGFVKWMVPAVRQISEFYDDHGCTADIAQVRADLPDVEDLAAFLRRYKASQTK
ncbi:hypothetical protein IAT38_006467 [Cryptococcus sp. DSM 104549]